MLRAHAAMALCQRAHHDVRHSQRVQAHGRGHDVHDGVDGADLVKVHLVGRHAVRLRLRRGQDLEHAVRDGPGTRCQAAGVHHAQHVRGRAVFVCVLVMMPVSVVVPMVFVLMPACAVLVRAVQVAVQVRHVVVVVLVRRIQHHVEVAAVYPVRLRARHADVVAVQGQARERGAHGLLVCAKVQQGRDHHVAAYAACALQVQGLRGRRLGAARRDGSLWHRYLPTWLMRLAW